MLIALAWLTSTWDECQWFSGTPGKTESSERLFYRRAHVWIKIFEVCGLKLKFIQD